jgi:Flp pilus assembly pilin Flp
MKQNKKQRGAAFLEMALLIFLVAIIAIPALKSVGKKTSERLNAISNDGVACVGVDWLDPAGECVTETQPGAGD